MATKAAEAPPLALLSQPRPMTWEDLEQTPETGNRYEIMQGELIVSASPMPEHNVVASRIANRAGPFVERNDLGQWFGSPIDVRLTPYDIVAPDMCFVARGREAIWSGSLVDGPPDLVIEVLSRSTRRDDLVRKRALYATGGVREYWIVDPRAQAFQVLLFENGDASELAAVDGVVQSAVLPGVAIVIDDVFRGLS